MYDCFRHAKVFKVVLEYFIDSNPEQKYKMSFTSLNAAHSWLAEKANWNKSVSQMLMRYEYPEHGF